MTKIIPIRIRNLDLVRNLIHFGHDRLKIDQDLLYFYADNFSRNEILDEMYIGQSVIAGAMSCPLSSGYWILSNSGKFIVQLIAFVNIFMKKYHKLRHVWTTIGFTPFTNFIKGQRLLLKQTLKVHHNQFKVYQMYK